MLNITPNLTAHRMNIQQCFTCCSRTLGILQEVRTLAQWVLGIWNYEVQTVDKCKIQIPTYIIVHFASTNYHCSSSSSTLCRHQLVLKDKQKVYRACNPAMVLRKVNHMVHLHILSPERDSKFKLSTSLLTFFSNVAGESSLY